MTLVVVFIGAPSLQPIECRLSGVVAEPRPELEDVAGAYVRFPELSADAYVAKGPLAVVTNHLLMALKYLEEHGRGDLDGGIFGYEGFQSRRLISEMLGLKRYWETLFRIFEHGILGLDEEGRILLVNPAASRLFDAKEARLIGEPLPTLLAPRDRRPIQRMLSELRKARLPEDRQVEVTVGEVPVRLRVANLVEDGTCAGLLVIADAGASQRERNHPKSSLDLARGEECPEEHGCRHDPHRLNRRAWAE